MKMYKKTKLKNVIFSEKDISNVECIKEKYGLQTDSDAIRMALRNFAGVRE